MSGHLTRLCHPPRPMLCGHCLPSARAEAAASRSKAELPTLPVLRCLPAGCAATGHGVAVQPWRGACRPGWGCWAQGRPGRVGSACLHWWQGCSAAASTWFCALPVLLRTSQPRERASGSEIQVCEDAPTAPTNLTALEDCPVSLVSHHLVSPPSSLQGFL